MCLYIDNYKHKLDKNRVPLPMIMKNDRVVWKVIREDNCSVYQKFVYRENTEYGSEELNARYSYLGEGIQSIHYVNEGYHAYTTRKFARLCRFSRMEKIVKFVIPEGAKYYIGCLGDIVSDQIRSLDLRHCR